MNGSEMLVKAIFTSLGVSPDALEEIKTKIPEFANELKTKVDSMEAKLASIEEKLDKLLA